MSSAFTDQECKDASASASPPPGPLKRKKANAGNTKKKPRIEIPLPDAPPSLTPVFSSMSLTSTVMPMTEMIHSVPHLHMDALCSSALAKLAPFPGPVSITKRIAIDPSDLVEKKRLHVEASQVNPTQFQLYMEKRMSLPVPIFFLAENPAQQLDQVVVCQRLRQGFLDIPTFTAQYESKLLVQSGPMPLSDGQVLQLPPCMFGNKCFGTLEWTNINGLTEPITMMQAMLPADFAALTSPQAIQPAYKWPCVLCHRKMPSEAVQYFRHLDEVDKSAVLPSKTARTFVHRENPDEIHQLWRNLENVRGGYFAERIFKANPHEGIFAPLVENNVAALVSLKDGTGRWVIDQSALVWKPPVMINPNLGEPLSHF